MTFLWLLKKKKGKKKKRKSKRWRLDCNKIKKSQQSTRNWSHNQTLSSFIRIFFPARFIHNTWREREREPIKARINGMRSEMRRDGRYRENYVAKVAGDVAELLRRNIDAAARHVFQPNWWLLIKRKLTSSLSLTQERWWRIEER